MGFPRRLLLEGETIALDLRPHWWFFAGPAAAGIPLLGLLIAVWTQLNGDVQSVGWIGVALAAAAWAIWLGGKLASWWTTHFVVTTDRLIYRTGVLGKHGRDIPLERINDITSNQSFFERIIGAGDLLIESAGERGQQTFSDVGHPDAVQQEIYRQMESNVARGVPAQRGGGGGSIPEQIAQLADLRDKGLLSPAEFEAKKAQLLERM